MFHACNPRERRAYDDMTYMNICLPLNTRTAHQDVWKERAERRKEKRREEKRREERGYEERIKWWFVGISQLGNLLMYQNYSIS